MGNSYTITLCRNFFVQNMIAIDSLQVRLTECKPLSNIRIHNTWDVWFSLVTEQQLTICSCSVIAVHVQNVSCWSVTNENHVFQMAINNIDYYTDLHKKSFIVRSLYEYIK